MQSHRRNLANETDERWSPPLMQTPTTPVRKLLAAIRRIFDLQLGSIYKDLTPELAKAKGCVLDVGCGAQPFRCLIPPDSKYIGLDSINAKEHFGYEIPDVVYYSGTTWPIEDASVDVMLITETMEHVFDIRQFLSEVSRCTRPGGSLIATVPFSARWHFIPYDYWRYTPSCMKRLLEEAGFEQIGVYARGNSVTVACYKVMALLLPLLAPQSGNMLQRLCLQFLGLMLSPLFVACALGGNLSLNGRGGDDCLGYTILAQRSPSSELTRI